MWWLNPGKEVLNMVFNKMLAPYVENMDMNQVSVGISQGEVALRGLRLKRSAFDHLKIPVDVLAGHLGRFSMNFHWLQLGNLPVEIIIEDVYVLVGTRSQSEATAEELEERAQATKQERLQNAEILHMRAQTDASSGSASQNQGLVNTLAAKILNNFQVTIKNIHVRFEDTNKITNRTFAAGLTLAGIKAVSTDGDWKPAFIDSVAKAIHKLASLESLSVYLDTDCGSLSGLPHTKFVSTFHDMIYSDSVNHQYILKPVTGEGRFRFNRIPVPDKAQFHAEVLFDEIGLMLDDDQFRGMISLVDLFHFQGRQQENLKYRPSLAEFKENRPRALLKFACTAIRDQVHDRHRRWTWAYFKERRDDRHQYVNLFKQKLSNSIDPAGLDSLQFLERKLAYEDIRFYRSIARSQAKKDAAARKRMEDEQKQKAQNQTWSAWLWGSSDSSRGSSDSSFDGTMTEEQRKELYQALDYDEREALTQSFEMPREFMKAQVEAKLRRGSFALRTNPHGEVKELISLVFDGFKADFLQRPDSFVASVSLGDFRVYDGTLAETLYRQIVRVKEGSALPSPGEEGKELAVTEPLPFFSATFEQNPLDDRADSAVTMNMRSLEILYHRGYVEAIRNFFRPPESQLESLAALLDAASETLEGLRKETAIGLEYALKTHKTIDIQMDIHAPIIIVPESVIVKHCRHLVIDAGRISVGSNLVDKAMIRKFQSKRLETDEEYKKLEALMYDRFTVKVEAVQFVLGESRQECLDALEMTEDTNFLHILERISIHLSVENSIVPAVASLPRFKVSGKLPSLHVNFSDQKYKTLMRLLDVAIPHFEDNGPQQGNGGGTDSAPAFPVVPRLFSQNQHEYNVDDEEQELEKGSDENVQPDGEKDAIASLMYQHLFDLTFNIESLRVSIFKTVHGSERPLGDISLQTFALAFTLQQYDMDVKIDLGSLSMDVLRPGLPSLPFMSCPENSASRQEYLLSVKYKRIQKNSPQFASVYGSVDQAVEVKMSAFEFQAAPEPILTLYDFIMTTFVPEKPTQDSPSPEGSNSSVVQSIPQGPAPEPQCIKVSVNLQSIGLTLLDETLRIATISMPTADVSILLEASGGMRIGAHLGDMSIRDDTGGDFNGGQQILSIEGKDLAEFRYETFAPESGGDAPPPSVYLKAGSLRFLFLEKPVHALLLFLTKLAKLKSLYDAATQATVQSASQISRLLFDISVQSPIIVLPVDANSARDNLTMKLGEIVARNSYKESTQNIKASLRGIQLASHTYLPDGLAALKLVDDIDIHTDVVQGLNINRTVEKDLPDYHVTVNISDVKLSLTEMQYIHLFGLLRIFSRVFIIPADETQPSDSVADTRPSSDMVQARSSEAAVDLQPELKKRVETSKGAPVYATTDVVVTLQVVKLQLYDRSAVRDADLKEHEIARLSLNESVLRCKLVSDASMEAEFTLKSITMNNSRPGNSKFRQIMGPATHTRNQIMLLYSMSGGPNPSGMVIATVDSAHIFLITDVLFALASFFLSISDVTDTSESSDDGSQDPSAPPAQARALDFRVNLHDLRVNLLENDTDADSQAIVLSLKEILLSQQGILALTVDGLGMTLTRMGKATESVTFLDNIDLTMSLDSRKSSSEDMTAIELQSRPIVFRASFRDMHTIMLIINKAVLAEYEKFNSRMAQMTVTKRPQSKTTTSSRQTQTLTRTSSAKRSSSARKSLDVANVIMSKEQLKVKCDGFELILIGDKHELPLLHFKTNPFQLSVQDWSSELRATATILLAVNYYNIKTSHWEPVIDPWTFSASARKDPKTDCIGVTVSSQELIDINLSTACIELAISIANIWSKEGDQVLKKARGSYAPYKIRNRTGTTVHVWSDAEGSTASTLAAVKITQGATVDWRFDDWKSMREHVSSKRNTIGVEFEGKPWEQLRSVPVDREGEFMYSLRPRVDKYSNKLICEVTIEESVKIVTLRSSYKVDNNSLYPVEIALVDSSGKPVYSVEKIPPGRDFILPIEAVHQTRVRIQPDQGFGYKWCPPIQWEDLMQGHRTAGVVLRCPHSSPKEAPFRFQAWPVKDAHTSGYPRLTLKLRAPLELENLLPFDVHYRVYDRDSEQNWSSFLRKGGIMPVHSVELGHMVLLSVTIQDTVFKPSDFAIINADAKSDFDVEQQLTLQDHHGRSLMLKLNYIKYPESGGAFKVQIISPFIVLNKTGMPFWVKTVRSPRTGQPKDTAGDANPDILCQPIPYMLSHPSSKGNDFIFKIGESSWSKVVNVEAPSAESAMVIPSTSQRSEIHVGVSWSEGVGKYKFSKVITLCPRFIVKNNLAEPINFREHGVGLTDRSELAPGGQCALHFLRMGEIKRLTVAYPGLDAQWSSPFNIEDIGKMHLRMRRQKNLKEKEHLIEANMVMGDATMFIYLSPHNGRWPFVIRNNSSLDITFGQIDEMRETPDAQHIYRLSPSTEASYAWDAPAAIGKALLLQTDGSSRRIDIMEIGVLPPLQLRSRNSALSLDVRAEEQTQILTISDYSEDVSVYKLKNRSISRKDSVSTFEFEAVQDVAPPTLTIQLKLHGLGISLINRKLVELLYLTFQQLNVDYSNSSTAQSVNFTCQSLQIDNQLHDAQFPVLLQPSPLAREARGVGAIPTIQASVVVLNDSSHGVLFIKYASILLQAITIEVDEAFLYAIVDFSKLQGASWEEEPQNVPLIQSPDEVPEPTATKAGQDVYFEVLELQPIILSMSFVRNITQSDEETQKVSNSNPLTVLLNVLTMTLGNLENARLEFNALGLKDVKLSIPELQQRIMYHYRQEVIRQLYRILGSADFLGNPVGLFTNVSSGVADIFYEPWNGVVVQGNRDLGAGIAKGAASFVKKTVFGLSDSMTKVTGSLGKGLSAATFDSEYQARRVMAQRRNKPRHAIYGVTAGAEAFANSIASGVEGVVMKPLEGAESEGALGFFKGMGKGIVGAVTKPVVGVFDLASNVSEGIRNTTTVFDSPQRERVRKPRLVPADGVLQPYSAREALGQYWMREVDNGSYRKEFYVAHINLPGGDTVILLTASRIVALRTSRIRLLWDLPFSTVQGVMVEDTGIRFESKNGKEYDRFVSIEDASTRDWFFRSVASVVKTYNAQRRIEK